MPCFFCLKLSVNLTVVNLSVVTSGKDTSQIIGSGIDVFESKIFDSTAGYIREKSRLCVKVQVVYGVSVTVECS